MSRKQDILDIYAKEVAGIKEAGLLKGEAPIASAQGPKVILEDGRELLNMCANNYLGLSDSAELAEAARSIRPCRCFVPFWHMITSGTTCV